MNNFLNVHWAKFRSLKTWQQDGLLFTSDGDNFVKVKNLENIAKLIQTGNLFIGKQHGDKLTSDIGFKAP